jgi:methanol--5-hydroxybenzimidazolylcobamide Co-methyltransferase
MVLAGGLIGGNISHVFAATVRAMGAARSLVAYERGASGPGKDCGYENVIVKAITGLPMSMEGKSSASAHSSLVGNVAAAACDLWSNEQVENVMLYGGWAPQVFTEILGYDVALMNAASQSPSRTQLRDLFVKAGPFDPQVLVLAPEGAWRIGNAIVMNSGDYYARAKSAALEALCVVEDGYARAGQRLPPREARMLEKLKGFLDEAPSTCSAFIEKNLSVYRSRVKGFLPKNYGL